MKARRGGLSLGAGFRVAQKEREKQQERKNAMDVMEHNALRSREDQSHRIIASPERDEFDDGDLDLRTQMLLNKFLSCPVPSRENTAKAESVSDRSQSPVNPLKRKAELISRDAPSPDPILLANTSGIDTHKTSSSDQHNCPNIKEVLPASTPIPRTGDRFPGEQHVIVIDSDSTASSDINVISSKKVSRTLPKSFLSPTNSTQPSKKGLRKGTAEKKSSNVTKQAQLPYVGASSIERNKTREPPSQGSKDSSKRKTMNKKPAWTNPPSSNIEASKTKKKNAGIFQPFFTPKLDVKKETIQPTRVTNLPCRPRSPKSPDKSSKTRVARQPSRSNGDTSSVNLDAPSGAQSNTTHLKRLNTKPIETQKSSAISTKSPEGLSEDRSLGPCILSVSGEKLAKFNGPPKNSTFDAPKHANGTSESSQPSIITSSTPISNPTQKLELLCPQGPGQRPADKRHNETFGSHQPSRLSGNAADTNLDVLSNTLSDTYRPLYPSTESLAILKEPQASNCPLESSIQHNKEPGGNGQARSSSSTSTVGQNGSPKSAHLTSSNKVLDKPGEKQGLMSTLPGALSSELGVSSNKPLENSRQPEYLNHTTQSQSNVGRSVPPPTAIVTPHYDNTREVNIGQNAVTSTKKNNTPSNPHIAPRNIHENTKARSKVDESYFESQQTNRSTSLYPSSDMGAQNTTLRKTELQMPAKLDSSSGQESPIRRSRRSRNAPTNYYARPASYRGLHAIIDDFDAEELGQSEPHSPVQPETPPNEPALQKLAPHRRVVYQSTNFHIVCETLSSETTSSLVQKSGESDAPYIDQNSRQKFGDLSKTSGVVHIDFDVGEMNAIYGLLTGYNASSDDDVSIQGLVSQAAILYRQKGGDFDELAHRIRYLRALGRQLIGQAKDVADFLIDLKNGAAGDYHLKPKKIEKLSRYLLKIFNIRRSKSQTTYTLEFLRKILKELKTDWLLKLGVQYHYANALEHREPDHIRKFLKDAHDETLNTFPCLLRIVPGVSDYHLRPVEDTSTLLRSREVGYATRQNRGRIDRRLGDMRKWELWKTWTGASNDVIVLSWSPDSTRFIAGAAAQTDEHHMQYNRNYNLLLGNLSTSKLRELPDHRIKRPLLESGPNSRRTYVMVDPDLYMTVNAVHWTNCGNRVYTSSFDHTVKLWDVSAYENTRCIKTLKHSGRVQEMAVSTFNSDLVATGSDGPGFSLWQVNDIDPEPINLPFPEDKCVGMIPSSLQWGKTAQTNKFLAGGMTHEDPSDSCDPSRHGYLALWQLGESSITLLPNLQSNKQNIFDIAWHPSLSILATGCTVPSAARSCGFGKDVRSLVRIYDPLSGRNITEMYQCPALDINQVTFCPENENYITASCTDGVTYVWDYRNPAQILHKLKHGQPIEDIEDGKTREQFDVGVRCSLWGRGTELFTGASDGVLKRWDVRLSPEDVLQEDVASFNQELMCASMSPDHTNIVLGDSSGGIHVVSTAPWGRSEDNFGSFELERAIAPNLNEQIEEDSMGGVKAAADLISSGKLVVHPIFGPGQGPNYDGPYAQWARPNTSAKKLPFTPLDPAVQALQLDGIAPSHRRGLDMKTQEEISRKIQLSIIRNKVRLKNKRKRDVELSPHPRRSISFQSPSTPSSARTRDVSASFPVMATTSALSRLPVTPSKSSPARLMQELPFKIDPQNFVDLTLDTDEEDAVHEIKSPSFDEPEDDEFEEDHWWPVDVDPNLKGINHES